MTVYVDSSVIVRIVTRQPRALATLDPRGEAIASTLVEVELPRAIDSLRHAGKLSEEEAAIAAADGRELLRAFDLMEIDAAVRLRAAGPLALPLRSLDAIHLASALRWHERHPNEELTFATHDDRLARAAQAHGLMVVGWPEPGSQPPRLR